MSRRSKLVCVVQHFTRMSFNYGSDHPWKLKPNDMSFVEYDAARLGFSEPELPLLPKWQTTEGNCESTSRMTLCTYRIM